MTREEAIKIIVSDRLTAMQECQMFGKCEDKDCWECGDNKAFSMALDALRHDVIFEQIKWERDVALDTLEEHGIGLGQKAEYIIPSGDVMFTSAVVRCKDCKHRYMDGEVTHYYWCKLHDRPVDDTDYCAWAEESEAEE